MHPALYWRGLLQESLVEVSRRHCAVDVYCRCVCESVCLALCCRCLLQVCVGECVPGIMLPMFIAGVCGRVCAWHYAVDVYCRCVCESVCLALCCRCVLQVRLVEGMYPVFVQDWLRVWPREQLFIMRYEDYGGHERERISELLDFLGMGNQIP